jgi:hypothetical protein
VTGREPHRFSFREYQNFCTMAAALFCADNSQPKPASAKPPRQLQKRRGQTAVRALVPTRKHRNVCKGQPDSTNQRTSFSSRAFSDSLR